MVKRALVVASIVMLCGTAAIADEASHKKAVVELLDVLKLKQGMTGGAEAMADAMVQGNPQLQPYRDVLIKWATQTMTWDSMAPELISIYQETFTEAEIRELIAFFKTKTGAKWVMAMPDLMRKGTAIGARVGQAHQDELMQMVNERTQELKKKDAEPSSVP
jgi:hypothetical protein